jgi:hypothetical protein
MSNAPQTLTPLDSLALLVGTYSNAKMRFQSFFILMTDQPSFFASS